MGVDQGHPLFYLCGTETYLNPETNNRLRPININLLTVPQMLDFTGVLATEHLEIKVVSEEETLK